MFRLINDNSKSMNTDIYGIQLWIFKILLRHSKFAGRAFTIALYIYTFKIVITLGKDDHFTLNKNTFQNGPMYDA
tara:strand:- start:398 stop:622 length:225 start_codon:yes stop_codon:yes gene_type:complete